MFRNIFEGKSDINGYKTLFDGMCVALDSCGMFFVGSFI